MSEDEELEQIRRKKLEELQRQAAQQQIIEEQQKAYEQQKYLIMRQILSTEARQRLENIRLVRPQFAEQVELQLIQLFQMGRLRGATPLSDRAFKELLKQISAAGPKKEFKIKNLEGF
ncbi:MAG: DNA-binding protein [Promethearchaeia archaeon]